MKDYLLPTLPAKKDDGSLDSESLFLFCKNTLELLQKKISEDHKGTTDAQSSADGAQSDVDSAMADISDINTILQNFAIFVDEKASGTSGGTFTSGSWITRTLNTERVNNISGCSLASSIITLPAGTYIAIASAPAYRVDRNKLRIYNNSDSTVIDEGQSVYSSYAYAGYVFPFCYASFTLTAEKGVIVQHRCEASYSTKGLGVEAIFSVNEVYAQIIIWKIA